MIERIGDSVRVKRRPRLCGHFDMYILKKMPTEQIGLVVEIDSVGFRVKLGNDLIWFSKHTFNSFCLDYYYL